MSLKHLFTAGVAALWGVVVLTGAVAPTQVPFALFVEGNYIGTDAVLEVPFEAIGKPANAWTPSAQDAASLAFAQFIAAIGSGQVSSVSKLYVDEEPTAKAPAATGTSASGTVRNAAPPTPKQFTDLYRQTFAPFGAVRVVGRIPLGSDYLYIWEGQTAKGSLVRGFRSRRVASQVHFSEVTSQSPLEAFLVNALGRVPQERWRKEPAHAGDVSMPISKRNAIFLHVAGNQKLETEHSQTAGDVLNRFTTLAKGGQFSALSDVVTPLSMGKLTRWVASVPPAQKIAFQNFLGEPRRVLKVVPLGSVDLVFWAYGKAMPPGPEDVQHSYVQYSSTGPRLTNILYEGLQDDVFGGNIDIARWVGIQDQPEAKVGF